MADPKSYSEHQAAMALQLEQTTVALAQFAKAANLAPVMVRGLVLVAEYSPYIVLVRRKIESRHGTATTDTANALVDATNVQFLSTDTDKVIYNSSTSRWGVVTAYVSTSQLTLGNDLFPDGDENYKIYNKGCKDNRQVNISGFPGYTKIKRAEYPVGTERKVDSDINGIVQIGYDGVMPDSSTVDADDENVVVHLYLKRRHFISQLTTFTGTVKTTAAVAATSIIFTGLTNDDLLLKGQPFTIAGVPGEYTVTDNASKVTSTEVTVSFFPGLECEATAADAVTLTQSTLTPELEEIFDDWCAGKMMENKGATLSVKGFINAASTIKASDNWSEKVMAKAEAKLQQIAIRDSEPIPVLARY